MPAKNPRVNVVVEPYIYSAMREIAAAHNMPLSMLARELIREALELREDAALAQFAGEREKNFNSVYALSHEEVWG